MQPRSNRDEINVAFTSFGMTLNKPIQVLIIGGAALIEYGLKDSTKDIDIICKNENERDDLLDCALANGYELKNTEIRHSRLEIDMIAIKGPCNIDIFAKRISNGFCLTEEMWERGQKFKFFGELEARYASHEDIFIMKLIACRPGDIEDCAKLAIVGLDFDVIFDEIESQYTKPSIDCNDDTEVSSNIWITFLEGGVGDLEDKYDANIPIADKISTLRADWDKKWAQTLEHT